MHELNGRFISVFVANLFSFSPMVLSPTFPCCSYLFNSDLLLINKNITFEAIASMEFIHKDIGQKQYKLNTSIYKEFKGGAYKYDQLNRLAHARSFFNIDLSGNEWESSGTSTPAPFAESFTYDGMGNILTLKRNGSASEVDMDDMTYRYDWIDKSDPSKGLHSNRLYHVNDAVSSGNYGDDIDDMGAFDTAHATINTTNNYGYDELGNLVRDDAEEIAKIVWNAYGKIRKVIRTEESEKPDLEFLYDAGGHRLAKIVKPKPVEAVEQPHLVTWYVRDAQGNVVAVYGNKHIEKLVESHVPCEAVVNFLVSEHSAESFADFAVDELEVHTWAGGEQDLISSLELANQSMSVLYEFDPQILLGSNTTVMNAVISNISNADFVSMIVSGKGLITFGDDLCSGVGSSFLEHLYASDRSQFLQYLNSVNPSIIQNIWDYFNSPSPYPGYFMAAADIMGRTDGSVVIAMKTVDAPDGCNYANMVMIEYSNFSTLTLENIYANYSGLKMETQVLYGLPYISTAAYNYFGSATLWDMIYATGMMTAPEMLEFYYGYNAELFMRKALRAHPTGFCVLDAPIELNLLGNKADIVSYFGQQALDDLMEYLEGLYTAKVEIFAVEEFHLYGSSRLGVHKTKFTLVETDEEENIIFEAELDMEYKHHIIGQKGFELSNHLGNVLTVITDRPIPIEHSSTSGTVGHFEAEIISISDYYSFGSAMPTRAWTDVSRRYRYGFNGMEKDDEVKGEGNSYDFGARIYDSRLGRWLAVDPLYKLYFGSTTYSFALNNPIILIDIDGRVIFDSEGNKVTITFNSQTGAIDKIEGTKDAKLMELIKSTHSNGAEGKAQIEKLNADNVKANITIHSGGVIFKSPKGNYGEVQGLSGASEPSKDDKDNGFNEILHIHIMNYDGIAKEGDLTVDDLENYEILDEYGRPIKKVSKKEKEKIVSDINKNKGVETHEEHQASFEGMTDEEIEIYKKKVPIEEKNNQTQANVNTLIYEAANSSEQAKKPNTKEGRTAGEREGKKAVVRSYKERNK